MFNFFKLSYTHRHILIFISFLDIIIILSCDHASFFCADPHFAGLTVIRLMGTFNLLASERLVWRTPFFFVAFDFNFFHQILHENFDVVGLDAWFHHGSVGAPFAVLTQRPDFHSPHNVNQLHVEGHQHTVGRPGSPTQGASEPLKYSTHLLSSWQWTNSKREQ